MPPIPPELIRLAVYIVVAGVILLILTFILPLFFWLFAIIGLIVVVYLIYIYLTTGHLPF